MAAMPAATVTRGAGTRGANFFKPSSNAIIARPSASVTTDVSGKLLNSESRFSKNVPFGKCTPSSFGTWSSTITIPMPALKPDNTGSEMKSAKKPTRSTAARTSMTPTINVSVAAARSNKSGSPPGTTSARLAPVRIAIVVVVVTLSTRELPSAA